MSYQDRKAAFDLLGISQDSSEAEIRSAWRSLVRSYHPDLAKSDPEAANAKLAQINAAFDLLDTVQDMQKQAREDEARARQQQEAIRQANEAAKAAQEEAERLQAEEDAKAARAVIVARTARPLNSSELMALRAAQMSFEKSQSILSSSKPAYTRKEFA
ncbi:MAG: DnaJ domain-containing protein [Aliishimia sp.]